MGFFINRYLAVIVSYPYCSAIRREMGHWVAIWASLLLNSHSDSSFFQVKGDTRLDF